MLTTIIQDNFVQQHTDTIYKESFKVYLTECEKTRELLKQKNEQTRNLLKELITTVKDTAPHARLSQLETSTMIVSKLDACHCGSMKHKETLSQMNKSEFRNGANKSIEKKRRHGTKSTKLEAIFVGDIIATKE